MNREQQIDSRVEAALSSLDGLQRAEANPYLLTRINAKLQNRREPVTMWDRAARLIARPAFAALVLMLLLVVNYSILSRSKARQLQARQEIETIISAEYATNNLYSIEAVADR